MTRKNFRAGEMQVGDLLILDEEPGWSEAATFLIIGRNEGGIQGIFHIEVYLWDLTSGYKEPSPRSWSLDAIMHRKWTLVKVSEPT